MEPRTAVHRVILTQVTQHNGLQMCDVTYSSVDMNPTFDEAYCIYLQGTIVSPWRQGLGTGTGSHKGENGIEIAQIMKAEKYRGAAKSLARPASRYILFDGENISIDASLVIYK